jgi:TetR/AcrR family transcriptional regulator, cholesterol catabolism regulator
MKSKNIRTFSSNEKLVEERREQIISCGIKLFNKKGFDGTSMRDIAAACKMTSANLYNYIAEKDDLIRLIMEEGNRQSYAFIREVEGHMEKAAPRELLVTAIDLFFRHIGANRAGVTFLYRGIASFKDGIREAVLAVEADETSAFEKILKKGCAEKVFAIKDTRLVADNIITLGQMWAVKHGILEKRYTLDKYIEIQTANILRQVCTDRKPC